MSNFRQTQKLLCPTIPRISEYSVLTMKKEFCSVNEKKKVSKVQHYFFATENTWERIFMSFSVNFGHVKRCIFRIYTFCSHYVNRFPNWNISNSIKYEVEKHIYRSNNKNLELSTVKKKVFKIKFNRCMFGGKLGVGRRKSNSLYEFPNFSFVSFFFNLRKRKMLQRLNHCRFIGVPPNIGSSWLTRMPLNTSKLCLLWVFSLVY